MARIMTLLLGLLTFNPSLTAAVETIPDAGTYIVAAPSGSSAQASNNNAFTSIQIASNNDKPDPSSRPVTPSGKPVQAEDGQNRAAPAADSNTKGQPRRDKPAPGRGAATDQSGKSPSGGESK